MATAINVILTEDSTAGKAGELVKVRMGFARNFLLPKGVAVVADLYNMKMYEEQKADLEKQANERREASEAALDQIGEDAVVTIQSKAGESGKLFGAITKEKIADAISKQLKVSVAKENITIPNPIKALGQHISRVSVGSNLTAEVIIKVENETN